MLLPKFPARVPIACTHCDKAKTLCDKKFPCSRCAARNRKCILRPGRREQDSTAEASPSLAYPSPPYQHRMDSTASQEVSLDKMSLQMTPKTLDTQTNTLSSQETGNLETEVAGGESYDISVERTRRRQRAEAPSSTNSHYATVLRATTNQSTTSYSAYGLPPINDLMGEKLGQQADIQELDAPDTAELPDGGTCESKPYASPVPVYANKQSPSRWLTMFRNLLSKQPESLKSDDTISEIKIVVQQQKPQLWSNLPYYSNRTTTGESVLPIVFSTKLASETRSESTEGSVEDSSSQNGSSTVSVFSLEQRTAKIELLDRLMSTFMQVFYQQLDWSSRAAKSQTHDEGDQSKETLNTTTVGSTSQNATSRYNKSKAPGKRRADEDRDQDKDDDSSRKKPKPHSFTDTERLSKKFACPFYKHNPVRYQNIRSCPGPGWDTIHRLKLVSREKYANFGI
jgi:hypothetical protein